MPPQARRRCRGPGNRYAWVVGIVLFMGIAVLLFTTALPEHGRRACAARRRARSLPDFAAPLATGDKEGDANVCQKAQRVQRRGRAGARLPGA